MDLLTELATLVWQQFIRVALYPFDPTQRVFGLYLLSSLLAAVCVYFVSPDTNRDEAKGSNKIARLARFVFPREVWRHRSSWVDIRYFVPHQMVRVWIYGSFTTLLTTGVGRWTHLRLEGLWNSPGGVFEAAPGLGLAFAYTVTTIVVVDFLSFATHYCQHLIPILWQFHKVHHSAEVLNPLSNFREHPIDNIVYAVMIALGSGIIAGVFQSLFGFPPPLIQILGLNIFIFLFNVSGYHLRHSHIWLRWPGPLVYLFGCPAHHQIHHSCKPAHINKNMAFLFPVWDVLFGTFYLPKQREELTFGIGDGTETEYRSFLSLYFHPFGELFRARGPDRHVVDPEVKESS